MGNFSKNYREIRVKIRNRFFDIFWNIPRKFSNKLFFQKMKFFRFFEFLKIRTNGLVNFLNKIKFLKFWKMKILKFFWKKEKKFIRFFFENLRDFFWTKLILILSGFLSLICRPLEFFFSPRKIFNSCICLEESPWKMEVIFWEIKKFSRREFFKKI